MKLIINTEKLFVPKNFNLKGGNIYKVYKGLYLRHEFSDGTHIWEQTGEVIEKENNNENYDYAKFEVLDHLYTNAT